jgi:hypothetical protein
MVFGLRVSESNSSLHRGEIEQLNGMEHNVYHQELCWYPLKQKAVSSNSAPFLYHPDSTFDFRDMLVAASQVDHWATWHRLDQSCNGCKFPIRMHRCDAKATMKVVLVYLLECFEYLQNSSVSARWWLTAVKQILRLKNVKKKGILLT